MKIKFENRKTNTVRLGMLAVFIFTVILCFVLFGDDDGYHLADVGLKLHESVATVSITLDSSANASKICFSLPRRMVYEWLASSRAYYELTGRDMMTADDLEILYDQSLLDRKESLLMEGIVNDPDKNPIFIQVWVEVNRVSGDFQVSVYLDPQ